MTGPDNKPPPQNAKRPSALRILIEVTVFVAVILHPVATGPGEPPVQVSSQGRGRARDQAARGWPPHGAKPGR